MAIRVLHTPAGGAVGMAAYAAGQNKTRKRNQKYAVDMWQQERKIQARREERSAGSKYRAALGGGTRQGRIGQQPAGKWIDPFEEAVKAGDKKKAIQIRAQRKGDARRGRLGEDPHHTGIQPYFKAALTKEEIARKNKVADDERDRQWKLEDEKRKRGQNVSDDEQQRQHIRDMEIDDDLQSGKLVLTPFADKEIRKARDDYAKAESSGNYSPEQLDELRQKTGERIRKLKRSGTTRPETPSAPDVVAGNVVVFDKDTGQPRKPREGERPEYQVVNDKLTPIDLPAKQAAESEAAEKRNADILAEYTRLSRLENKKSGGLLYSPDQAWEMAQKTIADLERRRMQLGAETGSEAGPAEGGPEAPGLPKGVPGIPSEFTSPSLIPQPKTKAEADALEPGTDFLTPPTKEYPDGQMKTVPPKPLGPEPQESTQPPLEDSKQYWKDYAKKRGISLTDIGDLGDGSHDAVARPGLQEAINDDEIQRAERMLQGKAPIRGRNNIISAMTGMAGQGDDDIREMYETNKPTLPSGIRWNPFRGIPVDSKGRGPIKMIGTSPGIWVMADGTEIVDDGSGNNKGGGDSGIQPLSTAEKAQFGKETLDQSKKNQRKGKEAWKKYHKAHADSLRR